MVNICAAALQMVSTNELAENLATAARLIGMAKKKGCELAALPENFPLMGVCERDKLHLVEQYGDGPIQDFLSEQARQHRIWLLGGTIPLAADQPRLMRAASLLYSPDGVCITRYDKIHLFDVVVDAENDESYQESATIERGNTITVADTAIGKIGLSVCYDLRFPELYRNMLAQHVQIITVPSAFTSKTGKAHWELLLRCRAVENLSYIIAPNQGGKHPNNRATWGHSMIIDPWGRVLDYVTDGEGIAMATIDLDAQLQLRTTFPALNHRRLSCPLFTETTQTML